MNAATLNTGAEQVQQINPEQHAFEREQWNESCQRWRGLNTEIITLICQIRDKKNSQDLLVSLFKERWQIIAPFLEAFNFQKEDYALAVILTGGNCTFDSQPHFAPPCGVEKLYQKLVQFRDYLREMLKKSQCTVAKPSEVPMSLQDQLGGPISIVAVSHARLVRALGVHIRNLNYRAEALERSVDQLLFISTQMRTECGQDRCYGELRGLRQAQEEIAFALRGAQALLPK